MVFVMRRRRPGSGDAPCHCCRSHPRSAGPAELRALEARIMHVLVWMVWFGSFPLARLSPRGRPLSMGQAAQGKGRMGWRAPWV